MTLNELHTLDAYTIIAYVVLTMFALCQIFIVRIIVPHLRNRSILNRHNRVNTPSTNNQEEETLGELICQLL